MTGAKFLKISFLPVHTDKGLSSAINVLRDFPKCERVRTNAALSRRASQTFSSCFWRSKNRDAKNSPVWYFVPRQEVAYRATLTVLLVLRNGVCTTPQTLYPCGLQGSFGLGCVPCVMCVLPYVQIAYKPASLFLLNPELIASLWPLDLPEFRNLLMLFYGDIL
jgi:hypothetical protein